MISLAAERYPSLDHRTVKTGDIVLEMQAQQRRDVAVADKDLPGLPHKDRIEQR